jgi:hypothetical protein
MANLILVDYKPIHGSLLILTHSGKPWVHPGLPADIRQIHIFHDRIGGIKTGLQRWRQPMVYAFIFGLDIL